MVQAINQLCDGSPSKETEQLLKRLNRPIHNPVSMVKLFGTNFDADYVNHEMLDSMEGNDRMYKAVDEGNGLSTKHFNAFFSKHFLPWSFQSRNRELNLCTLLFNFVEVNT